MTERSSCCSIGNWFDNWGLKGYHNHTSSRLLQRENWLPGYVSEARADFNFFILPQAELVECNSVQGMRAVLEWWQWLGQESIALTAGNPLLCDWVCVCVWVCGEPLYSECIRLSYHFILYCITLYLYNTMVFDNCVALCHIMLHYVTLLCDTWCHATWCWGY